jgi:hypothetical protein
MHCYKAVFQELTIIAGNNEFINYGAVIKFSEFPKNDRNQLRCQLTSIKQEPLTLLSTKSIQIIFKNNSYLKKHNAPPLQRSSGSCSLG